MRIHVLLEKARANVMTVRVMDVQFQILAAKMCYRLIGIVLVECGTTLIVRVKNAIISMTSICETHQSRLLQLITFNCNQLNASLNAGY